ncbi:MAG: hypothetical protein ACK53C_14770 [Pseudomonadota bacterium]
MSTISGPVPLAAFVAALDYARAGVDRGLHSYADAAPQVAGATARGEFPPVGAVVQAVEARVQVAASAKMIRAADRALGALLDVRA